MARSTKKKAAAGVTVGGATATVGGTLATIGGDGEMVFITTENDGAVLVGGDGGGGVGDGEVVQTEYIVEDEHGNKYSAGRRLNKPCMAIGQSCTLKYVRGCVNPTSWRPLAAGVSSRNLLITDNLALQSRYWVEYLYSLNMVEF